MQTHHAFDGRRFLEPNQADAAGYAGFLGSRLDDSDSIVRVAGNPSEVVGYVYAAVRGRSCAVSAGLFTTGWSWTRRVAAASAWRSSMRRSSGCVNAGCRVSCSARRHRTTRRAECLEARLQADDGRATHRNRIACLDPVPRGFRRRAAISTASSTSSRRIVGCADQPTIFREKRSITTASPIAVKGAEIIFAHEPRDAMLTARLAGLAEIQKHARRAIDALARQKRSPNESDEPRIFLGSIRHWLLEPLVVAASRYPKQAAHPVHVVLAALLLDELILCSNLAD